MRGRDLFSGEKVEIRALFVLLPLQSPRSAPGKAAIRANHGRNFISLGRQPRSGSAPLAEGAVCSTAVSSPGTGVIPGLPGFTGFYRVLPVFHRFFALGIWGVRARLRNYVFDSQSVPYRSNLENVFSYSAGQGFIFWSATSRFLTSHILASPELRSRGPIPETRLVSWNSCCNAGFFRFCLAEPR